eukprot:CAMPEP_0168314412 /NCGR_PEP_ID=MMETSP0210-20121227/7902_1 /TAXON_ID=40633 /ORGANISM="Condylostoma magnum, Strain COL2" /LENGTH=40 /DNA_ID= /DNA_START= /DNA_END= /DNA_ORIENTATION=
MTINSYIDGRALEAGTASTFTGDFSDVEEDSPFFIGCAMS